MVEATNLGLPSKLAMQIFLRAMPTDFRELLELADENKLAPTICLTFGGSCPTSFALTIKFTKAGNGLTWGVITKLVGFTAGFLVTSVHLGGAISSLLSDLTLFREIHSSGDHTPIPQGFPLYPSPCLPSVFFLPYPPWAPSNVSTPFGLYPEAWT